MTNDEKEERDMSEGIEMVELSRLRGHPGNANVMSEERFEKLVGHIGRSGRYPPLVVRRMCDVGCGMSDVKEVKPAASESVYQVIDGHHRWRALERLGVERVACVVWEVGDEEALVLLGTLNRLAGVDDPRKRGELLSELHERFGRTVGELAGVLPEQAEDVRKLLSLKLPLPRPVAAPGLGEMPAAVYFFLKAEEKGRLEGVLGRLGGTREEALMRMVGEANSKFEIRNSK